MQPTKKKNVRDEWKWLQQNPPLDELMKRYPAEWEEVGSTLTSTLEKRRPVHLSEIATKANAEARRWKTRIQKSRNNVNVMEKALIKGKVYHFFKTALKGHGLLEYKW